ncbi:MAG TPA: ComF family protein [Candidatus Eisenbacteria bacterium]|nr:ComF family protein [Candidatus Eisenbacteria bacterium]
MGERWARIVNGAARAAGDAAADLLDAVTDRRCAGCRGPAERRRPVCDACDAAIGRLGSALCLPCLHGVEGADPEAGVARRGGACPRHGSDRLVLAGPAYEPPLDAIVRAFKYEGNAHLAGWIASLVPTPPLVDGAFGREALLVPIPLHPARRASRGYDQAHLLAAALGRWWGVPVAPLLERRVETRPQARLDAEARRTNLDGAFRLVTGADALARGRPLWIVDDVVTTGATLLAAAQALEEARPAWILALAASHGGHPEGAQSTSHAKVAAPGGV